MKANLNLKNAEVFDISRFRVLIGENFSLSLEEADGSLKWFADNDAVLEYSVESGSLKAVFIAKTLGECEIQIQNTDRSVAKIISVEVYSDEASALGLSAGAPEPK